MDLVSSVDATCTVGDLFAVVEDLASYPEWLGIVQKAVAVDGLDVDPGRAWAVDLRGRLGPLARSKRLRMACTVIEAPSHVRFERCEVDGREHSPWVLDAVVTQRATGARLTMSLHYGGSFGGSILERMVRDEIENSRPRLLSVLAQRAAASGA